MASPAQRYADMLEFGLAKTKEMVIKHEIKPVDAEHENYLTKKWGINGCAILDPSLDKGKVIVWETMPSHCALSAHKERVKLAVGHEMGHLEHFQDRVYNEADLTLEKLDETRDDWFLEVDAWLRCLAGQGYKPRNNSGRFMLDCLYSYKVGNNISDGDWEAAREELLGFFSEANADILREYQPEQPPAGEAQSSSVEVGDVEFNGNEVEDFDAKQKEQEAKQGEGQDDNPPDGGEGDEPGYHYTPPGYHVPDDPDAAREAWLNTPEGMAVLTCGSTSYLKKELQKQGFSTVLTTMGPLAKTVFKTAGGKL